MNNLTKEEEATNYHTMRHIERVRNLLSLVINHLLERAEGHDQSKLKSPEVEFFAKYTDKLAGCTYNSDEYKSYLEQLKPALDHHYANNSHHPEFQNFKEEWKPVVGFEGHYEVSNYGNVRTIDRLINRKGPTGSMLKKGRLRTQYITPKGYCRLQLQAEGVRKNALVHILVAEAFLNNPDNKPIVNHKNSDRSDNRVTNLEWVTASENLQHAYSEGLKRPAIKYVVECKELDLITFGCTDMERKVRLKGYPKVTSSGIWQCINRGGKHYDLTFIGTRFETWMSSPLNNMNLIDIIEMLVDWKASSERMKNGNIYKSIEKNAVRFGINNQLVKILENTAKMFDWR